MYVCMFVCMSIQLSVWLFVCWPSKMSRSNRIGKQNIYLIFLCMYKNVITHPDVRVMWCNVSYRLLVLLQSGQPCSDDCVTLLHLSVCHFCTSGHAAKRFYNVWWFIVRGCLINWQILTWRAVWYFVYYNSIQFIYQLIEIPLGATSIQSLHVLYCLIDQVENASGQFTLSYFNY